MSGLKDNKRQEMENRDPYHWSHISGLNEKIFGKFQPERSMREEFPKLVYLPPEESKMSPVVGWCDKKYPRIDRSPEGLPPNIDYGIMYLKCGCGEYKHIFIDRDHMDQCTDS